MEQIRQRTGTVDTLDVALLTSLNLAREVMALREKVEASEALDSDVVFADAERLGALIELVEAALGSDGSAPAEAEEDPDAEVLTLPQAQVQSQTQSADPQSAEGSLLGPLLDSVEGVEVVADGGASQSRTGHREAREASS